MSSICTYRFERKTPESSEIPTSLWNVAESPEVLFVQGKKASLKLLNQLPEQGLAVVGTRIPQPRSIGMVRNEILSLRGTSIIILSGLARGIDTIAHQTAIEANIPTIAVIGNGLNMTYPHENEALREKILKEGGLVISEYPPGMTPRGFHFLRRNRLIAGWSKAVWVVEAGIRSGALNTARWARDQDRYCFATACFPGDVALAGNQVLIDRDHAYPFWGIHSLGIAWIELATLEKARSSPSNGQLDLLKKAIHSKTLSQGGVQVLELLDWALNQGWTPQQFYEVFEQALHGNSVKTEKGFVLTS